MTHVIPKRAQGSEISAGVSIDQIAAAEFGKHTQLASLELAIEGRDFAGSCDAGYSCAYTNTISWRSATTPLPMENDPRAVFERLFGEGDLDPAARQSRIEADRSILDSVTERIADLNRRVGPRDRGKLSEYLEAVRDIERRIQKAEEQNGRELPITLDQPAGIPAAYEEHVKLMFDLQLLAYQTDLTRVITFMIARELSGRSYPQIGVPESHHPISHHHNDPAKLANLAKINVHHMSLFAYYVDKLREHAGRRRLAARSRDDHLRRGHGRQQPPRPERAAGVAGGRRRGHAARRPPPPLPDGYAAGEPAPGAPRPPRDFRGAKRSATAAAGWNNSPCSWIPEGTSRAYPPGFP